MENAELTEDNIHAITLQVLKERCEYDLLFFIRWFFNKQNGFKFQVNDHHIKLVEALHRVFVGDCRRLIINMPPRYGKTEVAVIGFIAWCIAKNPKSKFIHLSYSNDLVLDNSSRIKELVESDEFQELWPLQLKADSKSKKKWYSEDGGGLYATAAAGSVTGFGAGSPRGGDFGGAIVIDDPLKPDDAESDAIRGAVNRRLNSTIRSRTNHRDTPIILIMQRLHDDDAAGFLLDGGSGEEWEHLCLKGIQDNGSALWEEKHTVQELEQIQAADKYVFASQYQQTPVPDDGEFFYKGNVRWYETLPKHLTFYGASDYAVTEGGGDFTEHGVFGVDADDNIYIADWWSGQEKADVWIETQLEMANKHNCRIWAGETGPIKSAVEPWLMKSMQKRKRYMVLEWLSHSTNNKEANARTFQALWEQGKIYLPRNEEWSIGLLEQLCRFPRGKYDDKVDTCSLFARLIHKIWAAGKPKPKKKENYPWRIKRGSGGQGWMAG